MVKSRYKWDVPLPHPGQTTPSSPNCQRHSGQGWKWHGEMASDRTWFFALLSLCLRANITASSPKKAPFLSWVNTTSGHSGIQLDSEIEEVDPTICWFGFVLICFASQQKGVGPKKAHRDFEHFSNWFARTPQDTNGLLSWCPLKPNPVHPFTHTVGNQPRKTPMRRAVGTFQGWAANQRPTGMDAWQRIM